MIVISISWTILLIIALFASNKEAVDAYKWSSVRNSRIASPIQRNIHNNFHSSTRLNIFNIADADIDNLATTTTESVTNTISTFNMMGIDANGLQIFAVAGVSLALVTTLLGYAKFQYYSAALIEGIPKGSTIVELDAQDGKNIFYLPLDCKYTAIMDISAAADDPTKKNIRMKLNQQLIEESVVKAGRNGSAKLRSSLKELAAQSTDCVLTVGGIDRTMIRGGETYKSLLSEVYRVLRPGGLFVFFEPNNEDFISTTKEFFPEEIRGGPTARERLEISRRVTTERAASLLEKKNLGRRLSKKEVKMLEEFEVTRVALDEQVDALMDAEVAESNTMSVAGTGFSQKPTVITNSNKQENNRGSSVIRPGFTSEVIALMPWMRYVQGIAVKP